MIDTRPKAERALLVGAPRQGTRDAVHVEEHLDELASLADTAGAEIVGRLRQHVRSPGPSFYIGKGKVDELKALSEEKSATLVVFDEQLSPAQGKNLEEALGLRVMDRPELILDIFATRARTREAKLEVELAQLEYLLPRLARMWVHLSRIRGGIGLRGPGETQLETDRRMIRRKIGLLKDKLEHVAQHRETIRGPRGGRDVLTAVLVGYTNAGKSSILKALTGADTLIENRLFATLDTLAREVTLNGGTRDERRGTSNADVQAVQPSSRPAALRVRLVDTVGFIRKLPHHLVASFRATLDEATRADVLLHVIDASRVDWADQAETVSQTLSELGVDGVPVVHVFNKMDLVADADVTRLTLEHQFEHAVCVSAHAGAVEPLIGKLAALGRDG